MMLAISALPVPLRLNRPTKNRTRNPMISHTIAVDTTWKLAVWEASAAKFPFIEKEHAVIGLLSLEKVVAGKAEDMKLNREQWNSVRAEWAALREVITACSLDATTLRRKLRKEIGMGSHQHTENVIHRSRECKAFFQIADALAGEAQAVSALHLMAAIVGEPGELLGRLLAEHNVVPSDLKTQLLERAKQGFKVPVEDGPPQAENPKSFLAKFGKDLTQAAKDGKLGPYMGRREELLQLIQTLARNTKNNPVLVGEAGVGKTAVVEALALRLVDGKVPEFLQGSRIIELSMGVLVAGTSYRGEFEERLTGIIREATEQKDVILFIDEIHTLIGTGKASGSMDAAQILKPALARGDLRCIGATTIAEYRKHIETDAALERRFEKVIVEEPSRDECIEMLKGIRAKLEEHHGCLIDDDAINSAVDLSIRFDSDHRLPDKAIDLLDRAGAKQQAPRLTMVGQNQSIETVTKESIADILAIKLGMPRDIISGHLGDNFKVHLQGLADRMKLRVIGQDAAIDKVAQRLVMAYSGISARKGPLGVFLFLGPSGVGKTELARSLAFELFGSDKAMIRLDMSEYREEHSISKLVGSPPGYVGYEEEGQLTRKLRTKPYSILLLDEAEKAHPKVFDLFLQLFDEGRITDAKGRTVDARNCIIILTSNIRPTKGKKLGFGAQNEIPKPEDIPELKHFFRPELLNRLDEQILFNSLEKGDIQRILEPILNDIRTRLKEQHGISLEIDEQVRDLLAEKGYKPEYGARELRRVVERELETKLAEKLIARETDFTDIWKINNIDGKVSIERKLS
jgi:ATP-dependent Clp protease ATP-binding subunit ClpC